MVPAIVPIYLFNILGVDGGRNYTFVWVGIAGAGTLLVAVFRKMFSLAFGDDQARSSGSLSEASTFTSERWLSVGSVGDDMESPVCCKIVEKKDEIFVFEKTLYEVGRSNS